MSRLAVIVAIVLWVAAPAAAQRWDGFNVIAVPEHPYGSPSAAQALAAAKRAGAVAVAVIPFLWQRDPHHAGVVRGADMPDDALRQAIRQARALGLRVMVKPHIWVEGSWAGAVEPQSAEDWGIWFERYRAALLPVAVVAAEEGAAALSVGTEVKKTTQRAEWRRIIADVRTVFPGQLTYAAHNMDEAEAIPFWDLLDLIAVTLYPPLGEDADRDGRRAAMQAQAARLDALSGRERKPVVVAEIGLRSAEGAARKPWESAEERAAAPDPALQAAVLSDWLEVLDRPSVAGVLLWRWFTDPRAGGPADTDFTVQGKPAERLLCERTKSCGD